MGDLVPDFGTLMTGGSPQQQEVTQQGDHCSCNNSAMSASRQTLLETQREERLMPSQEGLAVHLDLQPEPSPSESEVDTA